MSIFKQHLKKKPQAKNEIGLVRRPLPTKKDVSNIYVPGTKIILYRVLPSMVTKGGLHIPHEALDNSDVEYPHMGVILVGGVKLDEKVFCYGVFVYYNQFAGRRFINQATEQECIIVNVDDILAVDMEFKEYDDKCVLINTEVIDTEPQKGVGATQKESSILVPNSSIIN